MQLKAHLRFDALVEEASKPPRKHGFLPTTDYLYASSELRLEARGEVFQDIDVKHTGYVRLDQWLRYALEHIASKMDLLSKDYFSNASVAGNINRQESPEFEFVELAIDKYSAEHRTLYLLLLKTFKAGDTEKTGQVDPLALDRMIEVLVATLRSSGMGPTTTVMFKDDDVSIRGTTWSKCPIEAHSLPTSTVALLKTSGRFGTSFWHLLPPLAQASLTNVPS